MLLQYIMSTQQLLLFNYYFETYKFVQTLTRFGGQNYLVAYRKLTVNIY